MRPNITPQDAASLLLRVTGGLMLCLGHGTMKWDALLGRAPGFPDPLGLGPQLSAAMAMGAECVCAAAVGVGLWTRLMAMPVLFTMGTVALFVHHGAPWANREPSVLFFVIYLTIALLGPGAYALDARGGPRREKLRSRI